MTTRQTQNSSARLARTGEVLDLIRRGVAATTTDLAARMGVARSTVAERLETLSRHGLLLPAGEASPGRGRPATVHAFNQRAGVTLAAQVGMSGTRIAVTDLAGEILSSHHVRLDIEEGPEAVLGVLQHEFSAALDEIAPPTRVHGIGIGLPGELQIYAPHGDERNAWATESIADRLTAAFDCPVFVDRDVNFMALGEHRLCWPDARMFLSLKLGTVIACGLVVDGNVARGATGLFGEIGHVKVAEGNAPCRCGSLSCLNTVAGGAALAGQLAAKGFDTQSARDLAALADTGVVEASQAIREAGLHIGTVVAAAINLLNPDVITVWGYLVDAGDQLLVGMHEAIYRAALPSAARALTLERSQLGDDAGLRGAALTVTEHTLHPEAIDRFIAAHHET
ncbi:ROK family transcriptional regulator [Sciscionella marina]|uniref:ROK family transcriptional regulator n=1 Tax=Sciscionella marina TaxID=508770 RepID=UPI0003662943|nr:ROK family protein [Sciscionella marina]